MRLVLIDEHLSIVKEYESNCTEKQIDELFERYEKLIINSKKTQPPPLPLMPVTTLSGPALTNFLQGQFRLLMEELRAEAEVKKKADNYLNTKAGIFKNNFKTFFLKLLNRLFSKKKKPTEQAV